MFLLNCYLVRYTRALKPLRTFKTAEALAVLHAYRRDVPRAIELLQECLRLQESLGPAWMEEDANEQQWLSGLHNLASCYYKSGEYSKAKTYYETSYNVKQELFGVSHVETLLALMDLAANYTRMGDFDKAITAYEDCLDKRSVLLGDSHPDTVETRNILDNVRREYRGDSNMGSTNDDFNENKKKKSADDEW